MNAPDKSTAIRKLSALLRQRCPNCYEGQIYTASKTMHTRCPICNVLFEREPGYFMGSMYVSYAISSAFLLGGTLVGHQLAPNLDLGWVALLCGVAYIPFVPTVTRYARVIWMYFDHWAWPARESESQDTTAPQP